MIGRKGGEKVLVFWWFLVLALIFVVIISGVIIYYSVIIDVRELEADILADRIIECVVDRGSISDFMANLDKENFDFYSKCKINREAFGNYYANVEVYDFASCRREEKARSESEIACENALKSESMKSNENFQVYCGLQKTQKQAKLPQCAEKYVYVFDGNNARVLHVVAASNQKSGEVWKI